MLSSQQGLRTYRPFLIVVLMAVLFTLCFAYTQGIIGPGRYYRELKTNPQNTITAQNLISKDFSSNKEFKNALFIGDSFTVALELYLDLPESFFIAGLGYRVEDHLLYTTWPKELSPKRIFILLGINNLTVDFDQQAFLNHYEQLLRLLKETYPQAQILVQSIAPVTQGYVQTQTSKSNSQIEEVNKSLRGLCKKEKVLMLNPWNIFKDHDGSLQEQFSSDGLHLNFESYSLWLEQLIILLK